MTIKPRSNQRQTLTDLAKRAGVSPTTASLVMRGKADEYRISEETRNRVKKAAEDLDYAPNLLVRSMQQGHTNILYFFSGFRNRNVNDLYMDTLSTSIQRAAGQRNYDILVNCNFTRSPEATYRHLNGGIVDGVLFFAPQQQDSLLPFLRTSNLPTLLLLSGDHENALSSISDDVVSGMKQVAERLIELGHRRIAALTDIAGGNQDANERIQLLRTHLHERGVCLPDRWIVPADKQSVQNYEAALRFFLDEPDPPTAIFCWHDRTAYQMLELCEACGISVPERFSIVSYDGLHWPSATRHIVASVKVDMHLLATEAIQCLDELIQNPKREVIKHTIPVTLFDGTTLVAPTH